MQQLWRGSTFVKGIGFDQGHVRRNHAEHAHESAHDGRQTSPEISTHESRMNEGRSWMQS